MAVKKASKSKAKKKGQGKGNGSGPAVYDSEIIAIDQLTLLPENGGSPNKNVRVHSDYQISELSAAIQRFGFTDNIVIDRKGVVLSGNARIKAAIQAGMTEIEAKRVPFTGKRALAYAISANRIAELAKWDVPGLSEQLGQLDDMTGVGFDAEALKDLQRQVNAGKEIIEDEVPDTPKKAVTRKGDLWQLGRHRLLCGDATCKEDVERLMGGVQADMVFTDPPYGVGYDGGTTKRSRLRGDDTTDLYEPCCAMSFIFSVEKAPLYLWHAGVKGIAAAAAAAAAGYEIRCEIVWNKNQAQFGALSAQYKQKHEPCYYCFKRGHAPNWIGPKNEVTVWDVDRSPINEFHPTQKPVALAARAIGNHDAQIITDWFAGSGSTIIACEQLKRTCYAMEIEPIYVDVCVERWQKFTGGKAKRIKG